jgi:hypothetical protein
MSHLPWTEGLYWDNRYVDDFVFSILLINNSTNKLSFRFDSTYTQVKAVLFAIESNMAALALQGQMAKRFMRHLDPLHTPPQNVPFMRMVRLLDLAFHREYQRLIDDNILWLGQRFASTNSDFYQCPERREAYGCIVANMCSKRYHFKDGRRLFISNQTLSEGGRSQVAIKEGMLQGLEVVISFKQFDGAKTGVGVGTWLYDEHFEKGLKPSYVMYHSTDGASNAVASADHYNLLSEMNTDSEILHNVCLAHQNNRSAKYASGTGDFKTCKNESLRDVLNKVHAIIARVHRTYQRTKVVRDVQRRAGRLSIVLPVPSVVTRWDSSNLEVASLNRIMGDFNKALNQLLDTTDKHLLEERDGAVRPRSDFIFTPNDRTVLRQYECASQPCLLLSKFFQLNAPTVHETLFVIAARLAQMRETSFLMYGDISHTDLPDLTKRTKTIRVVSSEHLEEGEDGQEEQPMDICIQYYRAIYARDMSRRCGLTDANGERVIKLPYILAIGALLNPMLGGTSFDCFVWPKQKTHNANTCSILFYSNTRPTQHGTGRPHDKITIPCSRTSSNWMDAGDTREREWTCCRR